MCLHGSKHDKTGNQVHLQNCMSIFVFSRKQHHRSWHGAVNVSNMGFHLIVILCWLLNMQCHQMKGFPSDLVFYFVAKSLNCRAFFSVKPGISTLFFLHLFGF